MTETSYRPPGFDDWPQPVQLDHLDLVHTRAGLIEKLLAEANYRPETRVHSRRRLTKTELAAILLAMEESQTN